MTPPTPPAHLVPLTRNPSGPALSQVVAGVWRMAQWSQSPAQRLEWIQRCIDLGITSFDHADIYGGYTVEHLFGQALALDPALRRRIQIVGKCGIRLVSPERPSHTLKSYDTSAGHIRASVESSLRALRTDHLDLLLIHRPDTLMDPQEVAQVFSELQAQGKVLHFGVSNHAPSQLALLNGHHPVATHQIELSVLQMKALADGTLDQCQHLGIRPMIWSPLAGGKLFESNDPQALRVRDALGAVAQRHGVSPATVAFAWVLRHPARPLPITGSQRIEALREAVAALHLQLPREDWYRLWEASMGHPVP